MDDKHLEQRVRAFKLPDMSPDVRARVMAAAVARVAPITWSDRVWFSRAWRYAAAAAVVAVIAADQWTGVTAQRTTAMPRVMADAQAIEDVAREAGLPAQTAAWLAQRAVLDGSRSRTAPSSGADVFQTLELDTTGGL